MFTKINNYFLGDGSEDVELSLSDAFWLYGLPIAIVLYTIFILIIA